MGETPIAAGAASINLIDIPKFLQALNLQKGMSVIDLACGWGHYSFEISKHVGEKGCVYAIDLWEEGIRYIVNQITQNKIKNITPILADVSKNIPLENHSIDLCLMATVLHDLIQDNTDQGALKEVQRLVKTGGILAIIEFKEIDGPPGPPKRIRIGPEKTGHILLPYGFSLETTTDLGSYIYIAILKKKASETGLHG